MKKHRPLVISAAAASVLVLAPGPSEAAFIIQPNGKAAANFVAGTATTNSTLSGAGTLLAPGLTPAVASVYGGEPYTYTYKPAVDVDNTVFSSAVILNSAAGYLASGLTGGATGIYRIYHTFPQTTNASGQPTLYDVLVNGVSIVTKSQDQNVTNTATGTGVGLWELLGEVTVSNLSDTVTLTINTTTSQFVGARTAGVLIDYVGPIPEPATSALLFLGAGFLMRRRRC